MTAVASPPTLPQIARPAWGSISGDSPMDPDQGRALFAPRKQLARNDSSSSLSSTSSKTTVASIGSRSSGTPMSASSDLSLWSANPPSRKRPQPKNPWPLGKADLQSDLSRLPASRPNGLMASNNILQSSLGLPQMAPQGAMRPPPPEQLPSGQPVLYLISLNGTFERKTVTVPFAPDILRIGRQTNQKTVPTPINGYFDSKVLSRQHAEIFAERNGKVYIRDIKSSNGTFVNGARLSLENQESEPHELQTGDHLELGIDIVSEDQKTVVHHKVAAKVEYAGFLMNSNNILDLNFGDLDLAGGAMMMPNGILQMRGRTGANGFTGHNGIRMGSNVGNMGNQMNVVAQQRPFSLAPIATDQILKRLTNELRNARLQAQDLNRTNQFVTALLSKNNVKDIEKINPSDSVKSQQSLVNGLASLPTRPDPKARFSDPPAPPPQQPLPEKPDAASLRRKTGERPRSGPSNSGPVQHEILSQVVRLTKALNNAKRDTDAQTSRVRELEQMIKEERAAREQAEEVARRLEESVHRHVDATPSVTLDSAEAGGSDSEAVSEEQADDGETNEVGKEEDFRNDDEEAATSLRNRILTMEEQMRDLRSQLDEWKQRCEAAETERDDGRKSLAEMALQLRNDEARRASKEEREGLRLRKRRTGQARESTDEGRSRERQDPLPTERQDRAESQGDGDGEPREVDGGVKLGTSGLSRLAWRQGFIHQHGENLQAGLPYASMLGVVLIGMGLMVYLNGWQAAPAPPPPRLNG